MDSNNFEAYFCWCVRKTEMKSLPEQHTNPSESGLSKESILTGNYIGIFESLQQFSNFQHQLHRHINIVISTWQSLQILMKPSTDRMRIKIELTEVVASKQAHFFVLVQMKQPNSDKSLKYRTETSMLTNRPKFTKNQFVFTLQNATYQFKFALMIAKTQLDSDALNALVFGVTGLPFSKHRLFEQPGFVYKTGLVFVDRGKQVGRFNMKIGLHDKQYQLNQQGAIFDPLISRVLYSEQCTDQLKMQTNIRILQQKLQKLWAEFKNAKKQQQFFEKLYSNLERDEKQLKDQIDSLEKTNSKIQYKLNSMQNLQNLQIEIDMLSQSQEGKKLLIQRLQYFQDRIYRQIQQNQKLNLQYKKIRPEIESNLAKAQSHAQKLKGKQLQQFQLATNDTLLQSYPDTYYQYSINQQTIGSLSSLSQRSELTAQQAKLLLSQVSYEVRLAEMGVDRESGRKQGQILREIEREVQQAQKQELKLSQEEEMVYKIKLAALEREIEGVRAKIKGFGK